MQKNSILPVNTKAKWIDNIHTELKISTINSRTYKEISQTKPYVLSQTPAKNQTQAQQYYVYNNNFQFKRNMGAKQNQIFSHYAFRQFKEKLETKCTLHDIELIIQEESYTSKSSFLDNDILPVYQENSKHEKYEFKGQRIKRGLYKTSDGFLINDDVNAACNIIRKSKQKFDLEGLYKWARTAPTKIKLIP